MPRPAPSKGRLRGPLGAPLRIHVTHTMLLLGGIQLLVLGIIGEYLARVYIQGKGRPVYLLREENVYAGEECEDAA